MKITEKIYMLEGTQISSNCYLILAEKPFLVDTGDGSNTQEILDWISEKIKPNELDLIVNTHSHYDHISGDLFLNEKTGVQIAAHSADIPEIERAGIKVGLCLESHDKINSFEVVHTPGHTPGSICLYQKSSKTLISGDTIFAGGSVGRTDLLGGDTDQLISSLKKLAGLDIEKILPGHNAPVLKSANAVIKSALRLFTI